jgi:GT2 family glycosyltransferase
MANKEVTLFLTACNRPDLLRITLTSFIKYNTYPIKEVIIMEDSGYKGINDFAIALLPFPCKIIYNEKRLGQMKSIENGSKFIKTDYVFHCEEDWEFYDSGFIEESFKILDKDPKVCCVFLRGFEENRIRSGINIDFTDRGGYYYVKQLLHKPKKEGGELRASGVLSFNPGLRKKEISLSKIPYTNFEDEGTLGYYFRQKGMFGAVTKNKNGYVRHIGWGHHVN